VTLRDVLLESRTNGRTFMRPSGSGGFVTWCDETVYEFTAEDMVADDWVTVEIGIPLLTGGRFSACEDDR